MVVCHCRAVRERTIREAVRNGAVSSAEVAACSGAGTDCGGCLPVIEEIVRESVSAQVGACEHRQVVATDGKGRTAH